MIFFCAGLNVWCLSFWDDESSPYFQALHFFFGVGAFLAPLLAGNFLSQENEAQIKNSTDNLSYIMTYNNSSEEGIPAVTYPYSIIGLISLIVSFMFAFLFLIDVNKRTRKERTHYKDPPVLYRVIILLVFLLLLAFYAGIEIGFGQMIAVYAVKSSHQFSQSLASYVASVYWGTFTFSRGFSIFLALKCSPFCLVVSDCIVMALATLLLVSVGSIYSVFLWLGSAILGLGLASFYASSITWLEMHVTITNKIGSGFVIAASFGEMVAPLAISQYVTEQPNILMFFVLASTAICGFLIILLRIITSSIGVKQPFPVNDNEMEPNATSSFISETNITHEKQDNVNVKSDMC